MPIFKATLVRSIVTIEVLTRYIKAPNEDVASEQAEQLTEQYNRCCPDDVTVDDSASEARGWQMDIIDEHRGDVPDGYDTENAYPGAEEASTVPGAALMVRDALNLLDIVDAVEDGEFLAGVLKVNVGDTVVRVRVEVLS